MGKILSNLEKVIKLFFQLTKLMVLEVWIQKYMTMENQHVRCSSKEIDRDKVREISEK